MSEVKKFGAVILAAGKGKRMGLTDANKVTVKLAGKPIITHIVHFMHKLGVNDIVVVVGHAKESVMEVLKDEKVTYAEQSELLGTGHAAQMALAQIPSDVTDVLIVYGDDGVIYIDEHVPTIKKLFTLHEETRAVCTFLTLEQANPFGLGRIVRDENKRVQAIVEEKDATDDEKKITEINPGCFLFNVAFLKNYLPRIEKSSATGEYYLTSLVDLALSHGETIQTVQGGAMRWRGVNTQEELEEADELLSGNV